MSAQESIGMARAALSAVKSVTEPGARNYNPGFTELRTAVGHLADALEAIAQQPAPQPVDREDER